MTTDVDDFLAHYGVPGMKWGKRKADGTRVTLKEARKGVDNERKANTAAAKAAGYKNSQKLADLSNVGKSGTRRIEKRLANGETLGKARLKEYSRQFGTGAAVGAGLLAVNYGPGLASMGLSKLSANINAKRGAETARKLFADNKGLTSYSVVALAFDKAKGSYG